MKRNKKAIVISILLATIGVISAVYLYQYTHTAKLEKQYNLTQQQLEEKVRALENTNLQLDSTVQDKTKLQQQVDELNKTKSDLEAQLQAKREREAQLARVAQQTVQASSVKPTATYSLPANDAKAFIYQKESGNNPSAINKSSGACGLGQALPCSKMGCSLQDYACQDAWFTNYAETRYNGWQGAMEFWLSHGWW